MKKPLFKSLIPIFLTLMIFSEAQNQEISSSKVAPGWARTSVNAVIFRQNSLVTHDHEQYIAFYDSSGTVILGKRKLGTDHWDLHRTPYTGNVMDAHNAISIMIDGDGYLHMAWDHHGHKLNYCMSVAPGSLELRNKIPMTGKFEKKVTYPQFYRMKNGDLLFAYRDGSSGNGNLVLNRYDLKTQKWEQLHSNLIDGEKQRNAYWQMFLDNNDILHLSWVWRETGDVATNHDMCYARSSDGGVTWEKSNGEIYYLPINQTNAEYAMKIPQNSNLINQTSMTADHNSRPYIATYFQLREDEAPQVYMIYNSDQGWDHMKVDQRTLDFDLAGGGTRSIPISRPVILHAQRGDVSRIHVIYRDEEYDNNPVIKTLTMNKENVWESIVLTTNGLDRWEPTFDTELWKTSGILHLFVQKVGQGSGEKAVDLPPQMIYVMGIAF